MPNLFVTTSSGISVSNTSNKPFSIVPYGADGSTEWERWGQGEPDDNHYVYVDHENYLNGHASLRFEEHGVLLYSGIQNITLSFSYSFYFKLLDAPSVEGTYFETYLASNNNSSLIRFRIVGSVAGTKIAILVKDNSGVSILAFEEVVAFDIFEWTKCEIRVSEGSIHVYVYDTEIDDFNCESETTWSMDTVGLFCNLDSSTWVSEISIQNRPAA
jgi:hypothetical protein